MCEVNNMLQSHGPKPTFRKLRLFAWCLNKTPDETSNPALPPSFRSASVRWMKAWKSSLSPIGRPFGGHTSYGFRKCFVPVLILFFGITQGGLPTTTVALPGPKRSVASCCVFPEMASKAFARSSTSKNSAPGFCSSRRLRSSSETNFRCGSLRSALISRGSW